MRPIIVTISRNPNNAGQCLINPNPFHANQNDAVTFNPPGVRIQFTTESPFVERDFLSGSHRVVVGFGKFNYEVSWVDENGPSSGNGSGEVG